MTMEMLLTTFASMSLPSPLAPVVEMRLQRFAHTRPKDQALQKNAAKTDSCHYNHTTWRRAKAVHCARGNFYNQPCSDGL